MSVPAEFAAYLQAELAAVGYQVTACAHAGVACVFDENLTVFVYADAISWQIGFGHAARLPTADPRAAAASVVKLFQQARIPLAVNELRRRLGTTQIPTSVNSSWAPDGSGTAVVYARGRTNEQVAVTVTDGSYRWQSRDGNWHRLPWTSDAAEKVAQEIRAQIDPSEDEAT